MPSQRHEVIVELLRRSPDLIVQLFARVSDSVDSSYRAEVHSESFSNVKASPHAADLVLRLMDGETLHQGVIAEVQLDVDPGKLFSWPLYGVGLRAELQCETCVLVITPHQRVARWAEQPIPLGAGSIFQPVVLGPDAIPALTDVEQARQWPGLAFLSALAHATDPPETAYSAQRSTAQRSPNWRPSCNSTSTSFKVKPFDATSPSAKSTPCSPS